jgi:hypothetical protein
MHLLARQDTAVLRHRLGMLVPWAVVPYLVLLLWVNGLLSLHWRSPSDAVETIYWLGLLPLFDWYIVTKAEAAKNIVAHLVMYAPIGAMLWLSARRPGSAGRAFRLGMLVGLAVELGRYLRPGLEGDINAVALGGFSAWLTASLMPTLWSMFGAIGRPTIDDGVVGWRQRAAVPAAGAVEHL